MTSIHLDGEIFVPSFNRGNKWFTTWVPSASEGYRGFSRMLLGDAGKGMNSGSSYFCHLVRWDTWGVAYLSLSGILL